MTAEDFPDSYSAAKWVAQHLGPVFPIDHPELPRCIGLHAPSAPCDGTRGKHPAAKWGSAATTDPQQLAQHFLRMQRNVGLACGPAKLLVVDEDEPDAFQRYADRISEVIPATFTVRTARGRHFYFRQDGSYSNSDGALRDLKIDVRGKGGMVVAPGSLHESGVLYEADDWAAPVAVLPDWLSATLLDRGIGRTARVVTSTTGEVFTSADNRHAGPIPDGQRHKALVSYAGRLRDRNLRLDEARILMARRWEDCEQPPTARTPLTLDAALAKLEDVFQRYAPGHVEDVAPLAEEPPVGSDEEPVERYPVLDWHELWKTARNEPEWLCEPLLEAGRVVALYSPAKTGKSLLTLEVAAALAAGRPVLGNPARPPMRVLYVDLENSHDDLRQRLEDLGYGPDDLGDLRYLSFPSLPVLDSPIGGAHLLDVARRHDVRLVVLDTVSRIIGGEEDRADTFRALYRHAVMPLKAEGRAVLRLDHTGKDVTRGQRGSSGKADDVDAVWSLIRRNPDTFDLRRTHSRTNHGAEHLTLIRGSNPLRHDVAGAAGIPAMSDPVALAVDEVVRQLDVLGVPQDAGRPACRAALNAAGIKVKNVFLEVAIRQRKDCPQEPGAVAFEAPVDEGPQTAPTAAPTLPPHARGQSGGSGGSPSPGYADRLPPPPSPQGRGRADGSPLVRAV